MRLGNFSISLAVKDLNASREFYEKLGFRVIGGNGLFDDLQRRGLIAELFHDNGLVLQFLVFFKKMSQLFEEMFGQFFDIVVVIDAGIMGGYGNDLVVGVPAVHHLHHPHHFSFHQAERLYGERGNDQDIEGILVIAIGLGNKTVIHRVVK